MAPTPSTASTSEILAAAVNIAKRDRCYYSFGNQYCRSNWYYWGRWVLAGVVLVGLLIFAFCIICVARRRRKRGVRPMYGTGWIAPSTGKYGAPAQHSNAYPMNNYATGTTPAPGGGAAADYYAPNAANPPPAYGTAQQHQQYTGTTFNQNDGYYGVQQPQHAYQRDNAYPPAPPVPQSK